VESLIGDELRNDSPLIRRILSLLKDLDPAVGLGWVGGNIDDDGALVRGLDDIVTGLARLMAPGLFVSLMLYAPPT
jgi:hypothetical protein